MDADSVVGTVIEGDEPEDENLDENQCENDSDHEDGDDECEDNMDTLNIDQTLEDKAAHTNLSVKNVKSLIHHVLKDERVIQMVHKIAETGNADDEVIYEPKLTRLRVRKAVSSNAMYNSPNKLCVSATPSPVKASTSVSLPTMPHPLLGLQFPEEFSSDEEYDPTVENTKDTDSDLMEHTDNEIEEEGVAEESGEDESDKDDSEGESSRGSTPRPSSPATPTSTHNDTLLADEGKDGEDPVGGASEGGDETMIVDAAVVEIAHVERPQFVSTPSKSLSTPFLSSTTHNKDSQSDEQLIKETAVFLASLSGAILSPEKPHTAQCNTLPSGTASVSPTGITSLVQNTTGIDEDNGEIAGRTRSKFPLVDKDINEIEASFVPPDIPVDETTTINTPSSNACVDIDEDELQWQEWLSDLMNPNPPSAQSRDTEDPDDDTEYNFYADQHEDEGEEYRTDRGVKIPQREVDELIEEILNPNSGVFNTDNVVNALGLEESGQGPTDLGVGPINNQLDPTSAFLLESLGLHLPSNPTPKKNSAQTLINDQNEVGGVSEGGVGREQSTEELASYLSNSQMIQLWEQIQQHFQLLLQTFVICRHEPTLVFLSQIASQALNEIINLSTATMEGNGSSIWYVPGVEEGKEILSKCDPNNPDAVELIQTAGQPPKLPIQVQDIMMNYGVFWQFPNLLPEIGFHAVDHSTSSKYFLASEDGLLALGMDHYGLSAWKLIQQNLLPIKATRQLSLRVKNLCSSRQKTDNIIKCYKRTGQVVLPFIKGQDEDTEGYPKELPPWVQLYHRKRVEKEKVEEKRKERELEAVTRLVKTAGEVTSQSLVAGIKRSLSGQFNEAESVGGRQNKKTPPTTTELSANSTTSTQPQPKKKKRSTPESENSNEYNQLLYLAGLEANDKAARFAYKYLTEVKATVMDSPGVYEDFLRLVKKAREKKWRPVKLYIHVCDVLRAWPHLLKLFMAFVGPMDAIEANVLEEKFEFEQVKSFVNTLERKYSNSPVQLEEILSRMRELSEIEKLTQKKVLSTLGPLIDAHQDLLEDLKRFVEGMKLYQFSESQKKGMMNDFEEINLTDNKQNPTDVDDYEEISMTDTWTPSYDDTDVSSTNNNTLLHTSNGEHCRNISCTSCTGTDCTSCTSNTNPHCQSSSTGCSDKAIATLTSTSRSTGVTSSQTVTATCTLSKIDTPPIDRGVAVPKPWTREEDRYLLQTCKERDRVKGTAETLKEMADHLNRSVIEVQLRCAELLNLMKSMSTS